MTSRTSWGVVAVRILLLCSWAAGANAAFEIRDSGLELDGARFVIRGVVYSNTPIGFDRSHRLEASACLYARDFPLIGAAGANTVRTLGRVDPADRAFAVTLADNGLYWLAGFPLDPYHDARATLSPSSADGRALRDRILSDFLAWAEAWAEETRLIAFVFGSAVAEDYETKFAGSAADFYSLLAEAGAGLRTAGLRSLLTTAVADGDGLASFALGADDARQPELAFWTIDAPGRTLLADLFDLARMRTAKPFLIGAFGIDAFDETAGAEDAERQADAARELVREIDFALTNRLYRVIGSLWAGYVDEWWRGGPEATIHGVAGVAAAGSPDGRWNPAWSGLFGALRAGLDGLDSLRPREAYFELARAWGGALPEELSAVGGPLIGLDGVTNTASGFGLLALGGMMTVRGEGFSSTVRVTPSAARLPLQLGAVSACIGSRPVPLSYADSGELRGQVPWDAGLGEREVVVYRAGTASNPVSAETLAAAPGIFGRGVFRAGRPCPVDETNGVRPGEFLEVYATGLGAASLIPPSGFALSAPRLILAPPRARLNATDLEVVYSGFFPGVVGVYQTNVRVPFDFPPSVAELRLEKQGVFSNPHRLSVVAEFEEPFFTLSTPTPSGLVIQEGGPAQTAHIEVRGGASFCDLVRFEIDGLPPGVRASIPVGFPGQLLPLTVQAEPGAPRTDEAMVRVTGVSVTRDRPRVTLRLTVLPSSGDIRFRAVSGGWLSGVPGARFEMEDRVLLEVAGGGSGRGFNFLTIDSRSGALGEPRTFDTWASDDDVAAMETYLESLPEGAVVLGAIADDGFLRITDRTRRILRERLGAGLIDSLQYQFSWAIITRVGAEKPIEERLSPNGTAVVERVLSFPMP